MTAKNHAAGMGKQLEKSGLAGKIPTWPEKFRHGQKKRGVGVPIGMIRQAMQT
jgi:hypothetical protein